jgi:endonuclease YncB( thermonuclease family)
MSPKKQIKSLFKKIVLPLLVGGVIYFLTPLFSFSSSAKPQEIIKKLDNKTHVSEKQAESSFFTTDQFNTSTFVTVTRIIDGDTIELETGEKVRYIGINTPEIHHPTKPIQCFGEEAASRNSELVLNKKVRLVKDVSETDRYKRSLRYVYLEDGTFVNLQLVKEGFAYVDTVPPDVKFVGLFKEAMGEAREEKVGLWKKCK